MKTLTLSATLLGLALAAPAVAHDGGSHWDLDASHADIGFSVRHMMVSNTKGRFSKATGSIHLDDKDVSKSSVEVTIDVASVDTRDEKRDEHLRGADFFDVAKNPQMTFKSSKVAKAGKGLAVEGDLTIHGVTKKVTLNVESLSEPTTDPWGNERRGVSAATKINRKDFGLTWNKTLDKGGVAVGEEVTITIEAEFIKQKPKA